MAVGMSLCDGERRHRSLGRRGAGAVGVDRGVPDEVQGCGAAARRARRLRGRCRSPGCVNGLLATRLRLPAFVATLGMFYIARGLAAWLVAGRQLSQFPESYNLIGRKLIEILNGLGVEPAPGGLWSAVASARSAPRRILLVCSPSSRRDPAGQDPDRLQGDGHRRQPACRRLCRHRHRPGPLLRASLLSARPARRSPALVYIAYYRSFNPLAGQLRELDVIAAVIIGGGIDLRRLRLDHRRARRRRGDHAAAGPAVAADHPARRPLVRHAAALGQRRSSA